MITLTDKQYVGLADVIANYWPDSGERVQLEKRGGDLVVRVFNGRLAPREIVVRPDGSLR